MSLYEEREWLIGELAIAKGKNDEDAIISLSCELYERFGWCGQPYYTH